MQQFWRRRARRASRSLNRRSGDAGQQQSVAAGRRARHCIVVSAGQIPRTSTLRNLPKGREAALAPIREMLGNGLIEKSVHDLKRAIGLLSPLGVTLEGVNDDTYLAAYLLDPTRSKYELDRPGA